MTYTDKYESFLETKKLNLPPSGFKAKPSDINPILFDFQAHLVLKALDRGKYALFCDTGLGKTFMQLEWGRLINKVTEGNVLIISPLAVAQQTVKEGSSRKYNKL